MFLRNLVNTTLMLLIALGSSVPALALGSVECTLNHDKSRMEVIASNDDGKAYTCLVQCRISVAGQRAFDRFQCQFSMGGTMAEKTVCSRKGSGPDHFTKVSPASSTCVPR